MQHASRIRLYKSGEFASGTCRSFSQSHKPAVEIIRYPLGNRSSDAPASGRTTEPLLTSKSLERQRKDKLLENLIRKSAQVSSKTRPIDNKMARNFNVHKSGIKTHSHIQFITTPTADTPGTALLLHFAEKRYIIGNIHEGVQRAGLQMGARFFKAKDFFLTGKTEWCSNGGLLGMILTLADASNSSAESRAENARLKFERKLEREEEARQRSKKRGRTDHQESDQHDARPEGPQSLEEDQTVTLHGGPNLTHTIATARAFIFRRGTPIKVNENHEEERDFAADYAWEPTWEDGHVQVWAMAISPSSEDGNTRPGTPRKRSLGEYMSGQDENPIDPDDQRSPNAKSTADEELRKQQIREFVVSEMFSSSWRADNLIETPLREVVMPAALFVRDRHTKKIERYTGPVPDGTAPLPNIKVLVRQPWPGALVDYLPPTKPSAVAMSYIIRNHKQRGRFNCDAANALKVPPGPLWSQLAKGFEVQSSDGKIITSDMVLEPSKDGAGIAVVDLPSKEYIQALISRPEWSTDKVMAGIGGIVWILGPGLSHDPTLHDFIKSKVDLKHIISSADHCPNYLVHTSAATTAIHQHQIDPLRFPVPVHSNCTTLPLNPPDDEQQALPQLYAAKRGLKVDLEPSFGISERDIVPYLNTAEVVEKTPESVVSLAQTAQKEIDSTSMQAETVNQRLPSQDAEIICLGTGSAVPSQFRNVAGTLLRVPGYGSYLLDCGEGTLGQLKRIFTESELAAVFHDLKLIWISHLHADHHLGTASVIRAWYEEVHGKDQVKRRRPSLTKALLHPAEVLEEGKHLFIVGHRHLIRWLEEYSSVEDFGYNQLIPLRSLITHWKQPNRCDLEWNGFNVGFNTSKDPRVRAAIRNATSLSNLVTVGVAHCYGAQAVALTFPNGFKFSYSGDCRPSRELAVIGKGSTVLLHEATFDDERIGDAQAKKHSTTSEAIGVGVAMGAQRMLLTHFSQRYQKIPSTGSVKSVGVRLEDAEEVEDPMDVMEPPVSPEDEPLLETETPAANIEEDSCRDKTQNLGTADAEPLSPKTTFTDPTFASLQSINSLIRPPTQDMKIGVAFDYMRVKVGDIMHLEKFTPALRDLNRLMEKEEADEKAKRAAKEACLADQKKAPSPKSKGSGKVTKKVESAKADTAMDSRESKEDPKINSENDEGTTQRAESKRLAMPIKPDALSPTSKGIGKVKGVKHLQHDHSNDDTPPNAAASESAAAERSPPYASAPDVQVADGIEKAAPTLEESGDESERSNASGQTRSRHAERRELTRQRRKAVALIQRNSDERFAGQTTSVNIRKVQSGPHEGVRVYVPAEAEERRSEEVLGETQVLSEHQPP